MSDPPCTCPPTTRRIPHNAACQRHDEDRAWSISDRVDRSWRDGLARATSREDETT